MNFSFFARALCTSLAFFFPTAEMRNDSRECLDEVGIAKGRQFLSIFIAMPRSVYNNSFQLFLALSLMIFASAFRLFDLVFISWKFAQRNTPWSWLKSASKDSPWYCYTLAVYIPRPQRSEEATEAR
jgi:cellulose synthase/poly-beta-1,6-N-acetylglucosamine synthase-like glycosyltransferase